MSEWYRRNFFGYTHTLTYKHQSVNAYDKLTFIKIKIYHSRRDPTIKVKKVTQREKFFTIVGTEKGLVL